MAGKIGKEVEQLPGDPPFGHDHASQDEQRDCQDGSGVGSGERIVQELHHGSALVEDLDGRHRPQDHADTDGNGNCDGDQEYCKYHNRCHTQSSPSCAMLASLAASCMVCSMVLNSFLWKSRIWITIIWMPRIVPRKKPMTMKA